MKTENPKQRDNKMMKPEKGIRAFNFPSLGLTINATSIEEAQKKIQSNKKQND